MIEIIIYSFISILYFIHMVIFKGNFTNKIENINDEQYWLYLIIFYS